MLCLLEEICERVGMVPHGHKAAEYERLLHAGILPIPLADRKFEQMQLDVEAEAVVPKAIADVVVETTDDDPDLLARLAMEVLTS